MQPQPNNNARRAARQAVQGYSMGDIADGANVAPVATIELLRLQASQPDEPEPGTPGRFVLRWVDAVYEQTAPLEFLIEGLITKGSVNLLVGEGGSKKTWAALDLAVCVATGAKWLDFPTRQAPVLIVDEESGERRLKRRLLETLNGHLVKREDVPPIAYLSLNLLDMRAPDDVTALSMAIRESNAGLVIIDALADIMPGADENAVKDVQPVFMKLRQIAELTQAAIVVIHHSNKQNGYRGSTAIKGAVDLMLMVESAPKSPYITFNAEKARDIEPVQFTARATFVQDPPQFYLSTTEINPKQSANKGQRWVLRYLTEHGNSAMDDIVSDPDTCQPATARTAVYSLADSGHVKRTNSGTGRGVKAEYELTDSGRELAEAVL